MGGTGHSHALFRHEEGRLHRLAPQCKLVATLVYVVAVVATPREAFWAFGLHAAIAAAVAAVGSVPVGHVARRLLVEIPFLAFAVFLPIIGAGRRVDVVGVSLSVEGLWGAWNIAAKGTLGLAATVLLTASTPVPEILHGLSRLRVPGPFLVIGGLMVRYIDVVGAELGRLRIARLARADDPRWIWQGRAVAATAGVLFIRSYERGERVHQAMLSRGFTGTLPRLAPPAPGRDWVAALVPALLAVAVAIGSHT